ncbi:MAG: hypothetical protein AOA66_1032 [Candidatus Bathyarchaeota archaeon BA2]|nr:MAG: hypothetical protein AOA66_1032 [Candidatus Bathyarchaeota archaeon BA2]
MNWGLEKHGLNCSSSPSMVSKADGTSILETPKQPETNILEVAKKPLNLKNAKLQF